MEPGEVYRLEELMELTGTLRHESCLRLGLTELEVAAAADGSREMQGAAAPDGPADATRSLRSVSRSMAKALVVVESPAKAKTINKYLGKDYKVVASMGHVRDLPKSKLGVDVEEGFEPSYEVIASRKKVLKELKDAAKDATEIFVATDPDREGEAIGWHLAEELGAGNKKKIRRLMFNEITKKGVLAALDKPTTINKQMVDAQQARRVLDRLVGYKISPLLWDKVRRGLSAGRVQSVALKLVVRPRARDRRVRPRGVLEHHGAARRRRCRRSSTPSSSRSDGANIKVGNEAEVERRPRRPEAGATGSSRRSRRRSGRRARFRRSSRASCSRRRASRSRRR